MSEKKLQRLIDANALLEYLYNKQTEQVDVALEIATFPAVDAVPVVEGFDISPCDDAFTCSECHWSDDDTSTCTTQEFKWCPNCGAKILF